MAACSWLNIAVAASWAWLAAVVLVICLTPAWVIWDHRRGVFKENERLREALKQERAHQERAHAALTGEGDQ